MRCIQAEFDIPEDADLEQKLGEAQARERQLAGFEEGATLQEIPHHIKTRLALQDAVVRQCRSQARMIQQGDMRDAWRKSAVINAIDQQVKSERQAEQIRSEFGLPAKYPEARKKLTDPKNG